MSCNAACMRSAAAQLIKGIGDLLAEHTRIPVHIADDPLTGLLRAAQALFWKILEMYRDVLIQNEDELPPQK